MVPSANCDGRSTIPAYVAYMNDGMMPWRVLSATLNAGTMTEGWNLHEAGEDCAQAPRVFTVDVIFGMPFVLPPVIQVSLTGFDLDQAHTARLKVTAKDITAEGFKVDITTWEDSRVYFAEFTWLAIGA